MRTVRLFGLFIRMRLVLLAVLEFVAFAASLYVGAGLASGVTGAAGTTASPILSQSLAFGFIMFQSMAAVGLYHPQQRERTLGFLLRMVVGFVLGILIFALLSKLVPLLRTEGMVFLFAMVVSAGAISAVRAVSATSAGQRLFSRRVLVIGTGKMASSILNMRRRTDWNGFTIVGFLPVKGVEGVIDKKHIVQTELPILDLVIREDIDQIVVAIDERRNSLPAHDLLACRMRGIDVLEVATFFEREFGKIRLDLIQPSQLVYSDGFQRDLTHQYFKRLLDIVLSMLVLLLAWPLMLLAALAILLESGFKGPVFYRQVRVTQHGRTFSILKFRSMRVDAEKSRNPLWAQANDRRVTRVGALLRRYRIDELPQIVNVVRGDMSFVGPRPERPEFVHELADKIPFYAERHCVKAGLTGWAQLYYPYGASEKDAMEKLQYDLYYVKHYSIIVDLFILLRTVEVVMLGKGAR
jgi:sugar transferase (PEP-CTERM system associated)